MQGRRRNGAIAHGAGPGQTSVIELVKPSGRVHKDLGSAA